MIAALALGLVVVGVGVLQVVGDRALWAPAFPDGRGLVTNELAHQEPRAPGVVTSDDWVVTSGSLFFDDGTGSTGTVDDGPPDAASRRATGSAVFRAVSVPDDFEDVSIDVSIDVAGMTSTERTGRNDFDGVHLFARYEDANSLYVATVCRRDGTVVVKKKVPDPAVAAGGRYLTLGETTRACAAGWTDHRLTVTTEGDVVRLALAIDGEDVLSVIDRGGPGSPLLGPGRIGIRGDNTAFAFRDVVVRAAP